MKLIALAVFVVLNGLPWSAIALELALEADVEIRGLNTSVSGKINMPAGTKLLIGIEQNGGTYRAQDRVEVASDGSFKAGPFTQGGARLAPGKYEIRVTLPAAAVQNENVRVLMGPKGENPTGPLVVQGLEQFGNVGRLIREFDLGLR
jgi:hypothetical protein